MKTLHFNRNQFNKLLVAFLAIALTTTPAFAANNGPATGGTSVTIDGIHFIDVAVGDTFAIGLTNLGTVYTWGDNTYGELGNGTVLNSLTPVQVTMSGSTPLTNITDIAAGANFGLALTSTGDVYSWGLNDVGQLGINSIVDSLVAVPVVSSNGTGTLTDIEAIEANGSSAYALTITNGEVYAWGSNAYGQLGDGSFGTNLQIPTKVRNESNSGSFVNVVSMAAGSNAAYAIDLTGQLFAWGRNNKKQLGDGLLSNRSIPARAQLGGIDFTNVSQVVGGDLFAIARTVNGDIYTWGNNTDGATGNGTFTGTSNPTQLTGLTSVTDLYAAGNVAIALRSDGSFYSWGSGTNKTLGDNGATRNTPALVTPSVALASLVDGTSSMLGLDDNGNIYGWGANTTGIVGDGTTTVRPTPTLGVNFLASEVTFAGTAGTGISTTGTQWAVTSPAGTQNSTAALVGKAQLRTATTNVSHVSFDAGTFAYDPDPVVTPTPTPEPEPVVEPTPDPVAEPEPTPTPKTVAAVTVAAPNAVVAPRLTGKAKVKQTLTAAYGIWSGDPTLTYKWFRCAKQVKKSSTELASKAKCQAIAGATSSTYSPIKKDKSKYLLSQITATNEGGSKIIYSASTAKVK